MHPLYERADQWSFQVIGAAFEVHREMGPGLLEGIYEKCLLRELELKGIPAKQQVTASINYKGFLFEEKLRFDVLVDDCLLVELKAVEQILPVHKAQLISYLRLLNVPLGLLINFHEIDLKRGISRCVLKGAATIK